MSEYRAASAIDQFAQVAPSGNGLVARRDIPAGTPLGRLEGRPVDISQENQYGAVFVREGETVGIESKDSWAFCNASAAARAKPNVALSDHGFYALAHIPEGEQLLLDCALKP